jgi:hypothetical protein
MNMYSIILYVGLVAVLFATSCSNNTEIRSSDLKNESSFTSTDSARQAENANYVAKSEASRNHIASIPLETTKLQGIINSTVAFSVLTLYYGEVSADEIEDKLISSKILSVHYGQGRVSTLYGSIEEFSGGLLTSDYENITADKKKHSFTQAEMNVIFNYLLAHQAYFFNADEFDGLTLPYITSTQIIKGGKYEFVLRFNDPECESLQYDLGWTISKAVDELTPDHPMYGLVRLIENDFISQFE